MMNLGERITKAVALGSVLFATAANAVVETPFNQALGLLDRGSMHDAYDALERISPNDPDFVDALVELQKLHYRRQDWSKFFAYAQFYRLKLVSSESSRMPMRARMISLEAMALAKHCRWSTADAILAWGVSQKDRMSRDEREELLATRDYMRLHNQFPKAALANASTLKVPGVFSTEQAWRLEAKTLASISHPRNLSVKLKSECSE